MKLDDWRSANGRSHPAQIPTLLLRKFRESFSIGCVLFVTNADQKTSLRARHFGMFATSRLAPRSYNDDGEALLHHVVATLVVRD